MKFTMVLLFSLCFSQFAYSFALENKNILLMCEGKDLTYQNISVTMDTYSGQIIITKEHDAEILKDSLKVKKEKSHKEDGIQWWLYEFSNDSGETLASLQISEDDSAIKPLTLKYGSLDNCWVASTETP